MTSTLYGKLIADFYKLQISRLPLSRSVHNSAVLCKRHGRHHEPYMEPSSRTGRWTPQKSMRELYPEYTIEPIPMRKRDGRGPNGRIFTHGLGGGLPRNYRMIDWFRGGPSEDPPLVEKVHQILDDDMRSAKIALVGAGERRRYIIATENMKPGDMIKSSMKLAKVAVRAYEGDAYPVGSLPVGTLINCVQLTTQLLPRVVCAAGTTAQVGKKLGNQVVIKLPSKQEVTVAASCQATVGRVSNIHHNKQILGKAGAKRWLGKRPKSGLWHRKHPSIFGRRINRTKKMKVYDKHLKKEYETVVLGRSLYNE